MKLFLFLISTFTSFVCMAQTNATEAIKHDSVIVISKNPSKGFYNDYILFIPKGTPVNKKIYLLVEPNNTGKISDSMELHKTYAIDLASVSSVGNNVSTELRIPLLVPVFPRPAAHPLVYTHALDRDVILEKEPELKRLDLQLLQMIRDARGVLLQMRINTAPQVLMSGFSASATFTNRFSMIHPEVLKALAIGGFNGELMLPQKEINGIKLNYPLGTNDFSKLFSDSFHLGTYRKLAQYIYMGTEDHNDAVQFDDAYSRKERKIINEQIGNNVQSRFLECQRLYLKNEIKPVFKLYPNVGHQTTAEMNLETINFFKRQIHDDNSASD